METVGIYTCFTFSMWPILLERFIFRNAYEIKRDFLTVLFCSRSLGLHITLRNYPYYEKATHRFRNTVPVYGL